MRRPGLPVTMLQGGGAAAAGVGAGVALDGQRPGLGHASVASIFFPEGSMRSGKAFGPPRAPSVRARLPGSRAPAKRCWPRCPALAALLLSFAPPSLPPPSARLHLHPSV